MNCYSVIPADVKYDRDLTFFEIVLYGEISSLISATGECWASNQYFADLFNMKPNTISISISKLVEKGYVSIQIKNGNGRIIKIKGGIEKNQRVVLKKSNHPFEKNESYNKENSLNINNTPTNPKTSPKKDNLPLKAKQKKPEQQAEIELPSFIEKETWDDWVKYRKEIKHPLKPTTIRYQFKQLAEWVQKGYDANDIIKTSIINSWQGLFEPKDKPKKDNDGWSW
jgi:hypothetical protein